MIRPLLASPSDEAIKARSARAKLVDKPSARRDKSRPRGGARGHQRGWQASARRGAAGRLYYPIPAARAGRIQGRGSARDDGAEAGLVGSPSALVPLARSGRAEGRGKL